MSTLCTRPNYFLVALLSMFNPLPHIALQIYYVWFSRSWWNIFCTKFDSICKKIQIFAQNMPSLPPPPCCVLKRFEMGYPTNQTTSRLLLYYWIGTGSKRVKDFMSTLVIWKRLFPFSLIFWWNLLPLLFAQWNQVFSSPACILEKIYHFYKFNVLKRVCLHFQGAFLKFLAKFL